MASRHPHQSQAPAPRTTAASGARRTLFSHTHIRRPTASSTSGTSATTLQANQPSALDEASAAASSDIIARDEHGNYQIEETPQMPVPKSDEQEDREKLNHEIEELKRDPHADPAEVKAALQLSLHAHIASLEQDKWIYERDESGT